MTMTLTTTESRRTGSKNDWQLNKGKSFRGLLDYLENKEQSSLIGGNMFGRNARELAREFRLSRQLNPEAEKVVHMFRSH
ncbi:hypothetical protein [Nostoc sp. KVJ3]|uniref:hypothetical protein n=1 Tax=Nostoc sp. KVJ3 TaxID=457945 RepID=UPI00223846A7|nr:hypothetical protein [Nostoc sp. KVJ3]